MESGKRNIYEKRKKRCYKIGKKKKRVNFAKKKIINSKKQIK